MGADLSRVFVVDVEATCWETREEQGDRPNEVIEIGIVEVNSKTGEISKPASYLIKPKFTTIDPFCTELTGWKPEDVADAGDMFSTLQLIEKDFNITKEHVWFSFGEYDRVKLSSNIGEKGGVYELYGIQRQTNPFAKMRGHFNIKTLMALKEGLQKEPAMDRALRYYGETLEGRHHNGGDDAYNIAKIVKRVLS